jgi:hypothetical protein
VLVVRVNMMGEDSLMKALYKAFNRAMERAGHPPVSFTDEARVFTLVERDAERLGGLPALIANFAAWYAEQPAAGLPDFAPVGATAAEWTGLFDYFRKGDLDKRLFLAAALHNWRNHGETALRPEDLWVPAQEGFARLARHAKAQGYGAIAWLIDELVIWIRGKRAAEYTEQIINLSSMVDHGTSRVLPFFVAVAVQMDIAQTCPEDLSDKDFQERLGHIRDRFQPQITLEDQDLYEVCAERVLLRRTEAQGLPAARRAACEAEIEAMFSRHQDAIVQFAGHLPLTLVRRLYPFHPALLRILVDVTQALSRNRSAMAVLFALLDAHRQLPLGKLVPVGALWNAVYVPENLTHLKGNAAPFVRTVYAAHTTLERITGKIDAVGAPENGGAAGDAHLLQQLVRTILLCQLSLRPYFADGRPLAERITAGTLQRLNQADVRAVTELSGSKRVLALLRSLQKNVPQLTLTGDTDPAVRLKTEMLDIEPILAHARGNVQHTHRYAFARKLIDEQLGLKLGDKQEIPLPVWWRGSKRTGRLRLANVRELSYAGSENEFDPGRADFLVLIDYPFDPDPSRTRTDDIDAVERARSRATQWTVALLPQHFSPGEREALDVCAAVEIVRREKGVYLDQFSSHDGAQAWNMLENLQSNRRSEVEKGVERTYFDEGHVAGLKAALEGLSAARLPKAGAPAELAAHILDQRYPNHPHFTRRLDARDLAQVAEWVVKAAKTGQPVTLKSADMELVEAVAVPLQLVFKNAGNITRRTDGQYLGTVLQWVGDKSAFDAQTLRNLLMAEYDYTRTAARGAARATSQPNDTENWGYGLTREVANLFLLYLLEVHGFEAQVEGKSATIDGLAGLPERFRLVKDEVVDAGTWEAAVSVAKELLDVRGRAELPSSPEQAKLVRDAGEATVRVRAAVQAFEKALATVCTWAGLSAAESKRSVAAQGLAAFCEAFEAESGNAARARRLATAARPTGDDRALPLHRLTCTRKALAGETQALADIAREGSMFSYVVKNGGPDEHTQIVSRLQNLLRDAFETTRLEHHLPAWRQALHEVFDRLMHKPPQPPQPPQPPVPPPVQTPPVQTPPVQTPPVQTPPVQTPPVQAPSSVTLTGTRAEIKARLEAEADRALAEATRGDATARVRLVLTVEKA